MKARALNLQTSLSAITIAVTALFVGVASFVIVLTSVLHRTTSDVVASIACLRLAQSAEIDLLLHARAVDSVVQHDFERDLRRKLETARQHTLTEEEARALKLAEAKADAYFTSFRSTRVNDAEIAEARADTYAALEDLVSVNVSQAKKKQEHAASWHRFGMIVGVTLGALLVVIAVAFLLWLRGGAFHPLFSLARTMQRFGQGEHSVRAEENAGPAELRAISRQFNQMACALAAQRQAQIAFLGGVAHDLRNPLSALKMSFALLGPRRALPPERELRRVIEIAERQITRLDRMIGDFLDIAKIESDQFELRFGSYDGRALVQDVVELFEGTSPAHNLVVSLPERPVVVRCDALRIGQVLTNLVSNAIKYSPEGGPVVVTVEDREDAFVFRVQDEGVGIAEEDQERMFEAFRRVGLSKESVPGVGLGLFVVKKIVEAHSGTIEVKSVPGRGSAFTVRMPRELDPAAVQEATDTDDRTDVPRVVSSVLSRESGRGSER